MANILANPQALGHGPALPRLAEALLPYTRRELPGWGKLLRAAGLYGDERWAGAPWFEVRGKWHGYRMMLDLSDVNDRLAFFCGRYQEAATQMFMLRVLQPGDTFVDVGANTGMLTLLAARCVGKNGVVRSFEPNPAIFERLRAHVKGNGLTHVGAVRAGLSDTPGELTLRVVSKNSGWGTFAELGPDEARSITAQHRASVLKGDEALADLPALPLMIKIDVEGFECRVIRGLRGTIQQHRPAVMTEAVPEHLERAQSSLSELFDLMMAHGYAAFALETHRRFFRYRLRLTPTPMASDLSTTDLVWLHPEGVHIRRMPAELFPKRARQAP